MTYQSSIPYAQREMAARTPRSVEYELIARVTQRLGAAAARRDTDFPALVAAVTENEKLWSTLAADVSLPSNGLPTALRARLFYLYQFTVHHSRAVLANGASVEVLTDINTAVLRGLRGEGERR